MDGSYNQPYGHGHGPSHLNSPQTPSSATYQTNVNRSKTRKWVEARQQNYDGDDWGTDDFDQEPDSPPPQPQQPPVPSSSRLASYGQRTPSAADVPVPTNPPALHIPTQQAAAPTQLAHYPAQPAQPVATTQDASVVLDSSQHKSLDPADSPDAPSPLRSPDAPPQSTPAPTSVFAASQPTAPTYAEHTDHFVQVERKNTIRKPVGSSKPTDVPSDDDAPPVPPKPQQTFIAAQPDPAPVVSAVEQGEDPTLSSAEDIERHRMSTSPQLPDVARMSAFGLDLFSGHTKRESTWASPPTALVEEAEPSPSASKPSESGSIHQTAIPVAEHDSTMSSQLAATTPASASISQAPKADALEATDGTPRESSERPAETAQTFSVAGQQSQEHDVSPASEHVPEAVSGLPTKAETVTEANAKTPTLQPIDDEPSIAPLRTSPSPRASQVAPDTASSGDKLEPLQTSGAGLASTEPLEPRIPEYSPSDYDPKSLHREATFSTVASSPLKESDILRDEIIKSLSPQNDIAPVKFPPPPSQGFAGEPMKNAPRESTYTLSGYDSYWAEKEPGSQAIVAEEREKPKGEDSVAEEQQTATTPKQAAATPTLADSPPTSAAMEPDSRRRFSWEMDGNETVTASAPTTGGDKEVAVDDQARASPVITGIVVEAAEVEEAGNPLRVSPGVSHQVSQASSSNVPAGQGLEPPSPVSIPSEREPSPALENRRTSLAESKSLIQSEATPVAPSPPSGEHPALAPSPSPTTTVAPTSGSASAPQPPLMTFRDIMGLSSAQERIAKYDEARARFAAIESGLSDWIASLQASHSEHANCSPSFGISVGMPATDASRLSSPVGSQVPAQQPYYQQYLNASSPTTANAPGRSRLGGLSTSGPSHSAFGHSSDKIGMKGKELMQTAGKVGKGLFSKGKSKLRGTGDKQADAYSPTTPVQGKTRSDRRSSWALSLGNRLRAEGMELHSSANTTGQPTPIVHPSEPPTLAGGTSKSNAHPDVSQPFREKDQGFGNEPGSLASDPRYPRHEPTAPVPSVPNRDDHPGHSREISIPLMLDKDEDESTWDPFNGTPYGREKSSNLNGGLPSETNDPDSRVSDDWVVVPRGDLVQAHGPPRTAPEDSGIGLSTQTSQSDNRPIGLKRDPSFGLPVIKRSTTLDFGLGDALGSNGPHGTRSGQHPHAAESNTDPTPRAEGGAFVATDHAAADEEIGKSGPVEINPQSAAQKSNDSPTRAQDRSRAQASLPLLQTQNPGQKAVTPPGQWVVQESHLSEPLHQVSRKRSGTDDSQQFTYGLDKEMGFTSSSPISPPTANPRQRLGNQLPPSSAQRYPELFTNAQPQSGQRDRSNSGSDVWGAAFPRTESNEFDIPGVGPPEERERRKSTSIFKEFGNRIARASSRDRRPSISDSRPTASEVVRPDGVSETNVWTDNNPERRRKRSSLLSGLRSRPSMEMTSQANDLRPEDGPTVIPSPVTGTHIGASASQNALPLPSEEERQSRSMFGTDKLKLRASRTERWDDSGLQDQEYGASSKSRLSGLGGKVAGLAAVFRRPVSQQSQDYDQASLAASNFNEEARQASQQQRQSTVDLPLGEPREGRGRRGSASGLISGLLGRGSSHTREPQSLPPSQQPLGENRNSRMYASHTSMDQRHGIHDSSGQPQNQQLAHPSIKPVRHSPPTETSHMDGGASLVSRRFETVSPEPSLRSSGPNASVRGDEDHPYFHGQQPSMVPEPAAEPSRLAKTPAEVSPPPGGYYAPQQTPYGQPQMQHQPMQQQMHVQPAQHQGSFGHPNPQSAQQQSSHHDMLNIPGSRHSSISLQSSTQGRPGATDGQSGSRWRGFKNRISGQLMPQDHGQSGSKEDRLSGSKILGAFKRNSKQHTSSPVPPNQSFNPNQQWAQQEQHPRSRSMPQPGLPGHPQYMDQGPPHMQQGMVLQQQQQQRFAPPLGHPQRPETGPNAHDRYQYQRQPSSQAQQPFLRSPPNGMPGPDFAPHMHGPPRHQLHPGTQYEQYEQITVPAYGPVPGQGNALDMDRQMHNYTTSFQYNAPARSPPVDQWQQEPYQHGMGGPPKGPINLPGVPAPAGPSQCAPSYDRGHLADAHGSPLAPSGTTSMSPTAAGEVSPPQSSLSIASSSAPLTRLPPPPSAAGRPDYPRSDSEVLPSSQTGSITRKPTIPKSGKEQQVPHSPTTAPHAAAHGGDSKNPANLSVDVAKAEADKEEDIYDATPRIVQGQMNETSPRAMMTQSPAPAVKDDSLTAATAAPVQKREPEGGASIAMELENTEEARKRTIRLNSQEEKIYYDPADDDDNPTMTATSYPGQEWNPYGEFEYTDLGDEPHHGSVRR